MCSFVFRKGKFLMGDIDVWGRNISKFYMCDGSLIGIDY